MLVYMNMWVPACVCTCTYEYIILEHTFVSECMYMHMSVQGVSVDVYLCAYEGSCECMYVHVNVCIYNTDTHTCLYVHVCIHMRVCVSDCTHVVPRGDAQM